MIRFAAPLLSFLFGGFLLSSGLRAETQVPKSVLDLTLEPAEINFHPGPEYAPKQQDYAMVIGIDRTPQGRLWAAWVGGGDNPLAYFLVASSDDDGKTWSHPRMVIRPGRTPTGLNRSVIVGNLWTDPTGKLWLFYDQSLEQFDGRAGVWAITCENPDAENPTWSKPRRLWHGMSLNKPTVLSNGDWLLPVSLWDRGKMRSIFNDAYPELDDQRMAHWFASSDQGKTWTRRGGVKIPGPQFDEHMLVELKDGRLWMLARNNDGIVESFSADQGRTWSAPVPSKIQNPSARFFLRRLQSGKILLVKNGPIERKTGRSHMTAFLSSDEGQTWQGGLVIDERNGVSYPDGFQAPDGKIYILHDRERSKEREILLAKFTEADILAKGFTTPGSEGKIVVTKGLAPEEGEHLPNGIQLPSEWPPRDMDAKSTAPMPVPYLAKENIPAIIPINTGRQLFVDDFLIEQTDLARAYHTARKYEGNPVFKAETKHELEPSGIEGLDQAVTYLGHGGVFYHPEKKRFEMYYTASWRGGLALATSKDLIHWERPKLGVYQDNLILPPGRDFAGIDNAVWLDLASKDPNQRYKAIIQRGENHTLHTSPNGLLWSQGIDAGKAGDYCSFFFNPFRNVWVQSIKRNGPAGRGRARYYFEGRDFLKTADRDKSVYWTNADELDQPDPAIGDKPQLYSLNAVAYESLMLGEFYIHLGPDNKICEQGKFPKITEIQLGFSRDGFHWHRPDRHPFIAATRKDGDHDRGYIHGTNGVMLVHDDKLWFPYCSYSGIAPNGHRGMYTGASIGMATLRRDGFASMDAKDKPGTLTTRTVAFNGRHLFVNVDNPQGELRVEILDEKGAPIAPFTKENAISIKADSTLTEVTWKDVPNLDAIRGKPVKFRFHLSNGSLYAFWVSQDENGASRGYLGSGDPAYGGLIDTKGKDALVPPAAATSENLRTDALQAPDVYTAPVPARYLDENRMFLCGPGIAASSGGRLWVTFKTGDIGEDEDNCTVVVTSGDHGKTWSKPVLAVDIDGPLRTNDPGIFTDPNGKVTLMWGQVYGFWDGRGGYWTMTAENGDEENTKWSKPVRLSDGYTKNKPFITKNGDWLYLIEHMGPKGWRGRYAKGAPMEPQFIHPRPELNHPNIFVSKDHGKTLQYLSQSKIPEKDKTFQEHMIVEKKDGTLWMLGRTTYGIGESFSKDGGKTWTEMAPAAGIKGPSSRTFFQRLKSGNIVLVKNGEHIDQPSGRTHLTVYLSEDDGATWPHKLLLDARPTSYPDAAEDKDGFLNIVHDFGRQKEKEVIFHRITEADIKAGALVNPKSVLGQIANKATHETLSSKAYDEWKANLK